MKYGLRRPSPRKSLAARRHSNLWTFDADPLQPPEEWVAGATPAIATAPLCARCVDKLKYFIEQRRIQILGKLEDYFFVTEFQN